MLRWAVREDQGGGPNTSCPAAVAFGHGVYCFGGYHCTTSIYNNLNQIHVYVLNTISLHWTQLPPVTTGWESTPAYGYDHTAVLIGDAIYLWGGRIPSHSDCNTLYAFDPDTHRWSKPAVAGTVPKARSAHSASALGNVMYIYGGESWHGRELLQDRCTRIPDDIHKLATDTMVWSSIKGPQGFTIFSWECATMIGTKLFVFDYKHSISVFDTETNLWLCANATPFPNIRWGYSDFTYNRELYIFANYENREGNFNDLWRFNPETYSWTYVVPKGIWPRGQMSNMRCCLVGDKVIVLGRYVNRRTGLCPYVLDLCPSLKMLCKLAAVQHRLGTSGLPHNVRWELAAMAGKGEEAIELLSTWETVGEPPQRGPQTMTRKRKGHTHVKSLSSLRKMFDHLFSRTKTKWKRNEGLPLLLPKV